MALLPGRPVQDGGKVGRVASTGPEPAFDSREAGQCGEDEWEPRSLQGWLRVHTHPAGPARPGSLGPGVRRTDLQAGPRERHHCVHPPPHPRCPQGGRRRPACRRAPGRLSFLCVVLLGSCSPRVTAVQAERRACDFALGGASDTQHWADAPWRKKRLSTEPLILSLMRRRKARAGRFSS